MKKCLLFLCGLFFAVNAFAATPGYPPSIRPDQQLPRRAFDIDDYKIVSECCSRIMTVPDIENIQDIAQIPNGEDRDGVDSDPEVESLFCVGKNCILAVRQESLTANFDIAHTAGTRQSNKARGP